MRRAECPQGVDGGPILYRAEIGSSGDCPTSDDSRVAAQNALALRLHGAVAVRLVLHTHVSQGRSAGYDTKKGKLPATIQQAEIIPDLALRAVKHQCGSCAVGSGIAVHDAAESGPPSDA
jgi:hypothetical protein